MVTQLPWFGFSVVLCNSARKQLDTTGADVGSTASDSFKLVVSNEHGEYDPGALALYGYDMLAEPFKETTVFVSLPPGASSPRSSGTSYTWRLVREDDESDLISMADVSGGSSMRVTLTGAGANYSLLVQRQDVLASEPATKTTTEVRVETRVVIACKYVRRELRDLTAADSTSFFSAMREFYTVELEEGREKYREDFANSKIMSGYHNSRVSA